MRIISQPELLPLLGKKIRGKAHGGLGGVHGGVEFEGELVGIADRPQALVRDAAGSVHHFTIETMADIEVLSELPHDAWEAM